MGELNPGVATALAILALGVLIIIHEGGHYLVARWCGMRVDRFSIGFGPTLFSFKRGETTFQLALIPLGGYVAIAGLTPTDEPLAPDDPRSYPNRPVWQRLLTIFAGPFTNYAFAIVIAILLFAAKGLPVAGIRPMVESVNPDTPAAAAGLKPGDKINAIDGKAIKLNDVPDTINGSAGRELKLSLERDGKPLEVKVAAKLGKNEKGEDRWMIGFMPGASDVAYEKCSFGECVKAAFVQPYVQSRDTLVTIWKLITRVEKKPGAVSGPIGIVDQMRKRIALGFGALLWVLIVVSIALGLMNLLPLPALDGGRMVFLLIEAISRRRVKEKVEQTIHSVGIVVLLATIVVISVFDVGRIVHK
jgi:regulator of sigma E protease